MPQEKFNAIITGIGGQGNVLASRLIAQAYMERGMAVRTAETIGMSQRGGTVMSHVRVAPTLGDIDTSLVPLKSADLIIAFEPGEAVRVIDYLKPDGLLITATKAQRPVTASLARQEYDGSDHVDWLEIHSEYKVLALDGDDLVNQAGNPRVLNVITLGAAIGMGALKLSVDEMKGALQKRVKPQYLELNYKALELGIEHCTNNACDIVE